MTAVMRKKISDCENCLVGSGEVLKVGSYYYVQCNHCSNETARTNQKDFAIEMWNNKNYDIKKERELLRETNCKKEFVIDKNDAEFFNKMFLTAVAEDKKEKVRDELLAFDKNILNIIFNKKATVVIMKDGRKGVAKLKEGDLHNLYIGFIYAYRKAIRGKGFCCGPSIFGRICEYTYNPNKPLSLQQEIRVMSDFDKEFYGRGVGKKVMVTLLD